MIVSAPAKYPFQQTLADFADIGGHNFLLYTNRYSRWIEVARLGIKAWRLDCQVFLKWFGSFGVPEELSSDCGPPFNSFSYDEFLCRWDVRKRQLSAITHRVMGVQRQL